MRGKGPVFSFKADRYEAFFDVLLKPCKLRVFLYACPEDPWSARVWKRAHAFQLEVERAYALGRLFKFGSDSPDFRIVYLAQELEGKMDGFWLDPAYAVEAPVKAGLDGPQELFYLIWQLYGNESPYIRLLKT